MVCQIQKYEENKIELCKSIMCEYVLRILFKK